MRSALVALFAVSCGQTRPCDGCITKIGECVAGDTALSCGSDGRACVACGASRVCRAGACELLPVDAGQGGGAGGGITTGGGAAGGGVAGGSSIPDGSVEVTFRWDGLRCEPLGCPDCSLISCSQASLLRLNALEVTAASLRNEGCVVDFDGGARASVDCSGRCTLTQGQCNLSPDAGRMSTYGSCTNLGGFGNDCVMR